MPHSTENEDIVQALRVVQTGGANCETHQRAHELVTRQALYEIQQILDIDDYIIPHGMFPCVNYALSFTPKAQPSDDALRTADSMIQDDWETVLPIFRDAFEGKGREIPAADLHCFKAAQKRISQAIA
ncbi:hypothetical protein PWT90_02195 [Aphanocladium album]|nr:hypothetical protein PWT90_02195 [Aphanocladium album]